MILEQFRKHTIQELIYNRRILRTEIEKVIKQDFHLCIIGSVLSQRLFTEKSDIDIGIFLYYDETVKPGPNEELTEKVRDILSKLIFEFGNVDAVVFNNRYLKGMEI